MHVKLPGYLYLHVAGSDGRDKKRGKQTNRNKSKESKEWDDRGGWYGEIAGTEDTTMPHYNTDQIGWMEPGQDILVNSLKLAFFISIYCRVFWKSAWNELMD